MDNFEASHKPTKQEFSEFSKCWECEKSGLHNEYVVCCTGTRMYFCEECETKLIKEKKICQHQ